MYFDMGTRPIFLGHFLTYYHYHFWFVPPEWEAKVFVALAVVGQLSVYIPEFLRKYDLNKSAKFDVVIWRRLRK